MSPSIIHHKKESSPVGLVQRCLHQSYITKKSHPQWVWSRDVSIKHISSSGFCKQSTANLWLISPKEVISSVSGLDKYIFLSCLALPQCQQTIYFLVVSLPSHNVGRHCLYLSLPSHNVGGHCLCLCPHTGLYCFLSAYRTLSLSVFITSVK